MSSCVGLVELVQEAVCAGQVDAGLRGLERRIDAVPRPDGLAEQPGAGGGVAPGDCELPRGTGGAGAERLAARRLGPLLQLGDRGGGDVEVAGGDRDRHLRGEEERAPLTREPALVVEGLRDRPQRGVDLALVEAEEREPGLRVEPALDRLAERRRRALVVAAAAADLAELVEGPRRVARVGDEQVLRRLFGVALGLLEVAADPHDLGPVEAAQAGEVADRLALAPAGRVVGPLACAAASRRGSGTPRSCCSTRRRWSTARSRRP